MKNFTCRNSAMFAVIVFTLTTQLWAFGCQNQTSSSSGSMNSSGRGFPLHEEVIPGSLSVTLFCHNLPNKKTAAWSYVSDGFAGTGQSEMVMTIIRRREEKDNDFPREPIIFFRTIYGLAKQNQLVSAGDYTKLGPSGKQFLAPQFHGALYLPAEPMEGVKLPQGALAVVPVTDEELDAYEIGGASRVSARLARQSLFYPFPTWCDRDRASAFTAAEIQSMKSEPINEALTASLFEAGILSQGANLTLSLIPKAQDKFIKIIKDLPPNAALRLLLGLDKRANAFLVWTHGDPQAVSPSGSDGSRMSGSFVEILPGVEKNEFGMFVDGYIIMLTADSWNKLKTSVIDRKDVSFSSDSSGLLKEFKIAFLERDYQNPVDGRGYYAEGVWQIYGSDADSKLKPKDAEKKIVEMNSLRLYLPDALLRQRLSDDVTSLARFVEALQREISVYWDKAGPPKAKGLIIAIGVKPNGKVRAWCEAVEGEIAADKLAELEKVLSQMPALAVKDGPIAIALQMSINGQIPAKFPEGPKVWADAAKQAKEPLMIPDGLFKVIWPD